MSAPQTRIAIVSRGPSEAMDAILAHGERLAEALRAQGAQVDLVLRAADGTWSVQGDAERVELLATLRLFDLVVVQYNPFLWGRRGFAPWLPLALWRLRARAPRPRIALFVHEMFLDLRLPWRWLAMGLWQRVQLVAARPAADIVFVATEAWTRRLARWRPRRPTLHTPGGGNVPDQRHARAEMRAELALGPEKLAVATLSSGEPERRHDHVARALHALVEAGHDVVLLALGSGGVVPSGAPDSIRVIRPGRISDEQLGRHLAAADLFLAPFPDGVSTRRTSVMAPLEHEVPVVATDGHGTDSVWRSAAPAVRLASVDRPDDFAAAAVELASDADARLRAGAAGRALYLSSFEWSHAASIILSSIQEARVSP